MNVIKRSNNDMILVDKGKGEYVVIDDLSGDLEIVTIHTSNWSCTKEEKEEYLNKIFKACL